MDVCSEPPTLPAPEEYLENGQDQKLYLEVSKGQQDGIELHISETDDAGQICLVLHVRKVRDQVVKDHDDA